MKFLVDELPYYGEYCPFASKENCYLSIPLEECPRYWDKDKVDSYKNPHECQLLKEAPILV
jgi:hypothetical protein